MFEHHEGAVNVFPENEAPWPMNPDSFNPYAPPTTPSPSTHSADRWRRGGQVAVRAVAVIAGFSLVADPLILPGVETALIQTLGGYVLARGVGLMFLAAGFLPWPGDRLKAVRTTLTDQDGPPAEEL